MTEEQTDKGSIDVESKVITQGRSGEIEGEVLGGSSIVDLMDDDK